MQAVVTALRGASITRADGGAITVIDYDPTPGALDRLNALAVTFAGMSETDWGVTVRIYVDTASDVAAAERFARSLAPMVDAAVDSIPAPRTSWSKTWSADLNAYVIETTLAFPRDDF